jgi:CHRD domain/PEP-CTERM motif
MRLRLRHLFDSGPQTVTQNQWISYGRQIMRTHFCIIALLFLTVATQTVVRADTITYDAVLNGASVIPPTTSPGTGFGSVIINTVLQTMEVEIEFSGLESPATASHVHCCTSTPGTGNAGVATQVPAFVGFPLGVTSGTYDHTFDLTLASTYNPAFVTAKGSVANAESALLAGLAADESYMNVHTTMFPGGEISGFLTVATPEPSSLLLIGAGLLGLVVIGRGKFMLNTPSQ